MTGEPKQDAGTSEVTEQKVGSWDQVVGFFRDHPTLVLSLLYLYATGVGMEYSAALYGSFGINVFDYFEITDFLLAAFKNPFVVAATGMTGALLVGFFVIEVSAPLRPGRRLRNDDTYRRRILIAILILVLTFVSLPALGAIGWAYRIKDGQTPAVDVWYRSFSGSAGQVTEPGLRLIGATQKAVFFYDVDAKPKRTIVIPQSQLVSIEVPEQD